MATLRDVLHGCVRAAGLREACVAMVCTRGVPPRGARDPRLAENRFYAYALPYVWIAPREIIVKDGVVHTANRGVLEGISRRTAMELCRTIRGVQTSRRTRSVMVDARCSGCARGRSCSWAQTRWVERISSTARSPITTHGAMVLPLVTWGMTDASAMRSPWTP